MDEPVEIVELTGLGALAPVLAAWHHREWGHLYDPGVWDLDDAIREFEEMAYQDIADVLGISIGTVESRLFRARARFKDKLLQLHPEFGQGE